MNRLIFCLVAFLTAGAARASEVPVEISARVEPGSIHIGDPVTYYLEVTAPPGARTVFEPPRLSGLEIRDTGERPLENGREYWLSLTTFTVGEREVPGMKVRVILPGGEEKEIESPPVPLKVESLLPEGQENPQPRDIKDQAVLPADPRPWIAAAAAAIALAAAVWFVRRRRRRPAGPGPAAPPVPPHLAALAALEAIRAEDLPAQGRVGEYYVRVSDVVRRYLEDRFNLRAPERTTEEFLVEMASADSLSGRHRELLAEFLTRCDLVKFARYGPTRAEMEQVWDAAVGVVKETAPEEAAA
ncbi:MAG TPA: hypothetical protein PLI51_11845 [bacterium]|nr:hypothetical protein [bacterium]HPQ67411.1 hypothetical protein [bacterium]